MGDWRSKVAGCDYLHRNKSGNHLTRHSKIFASKN
jgi:hypothetical protein